MAATATATEVPRISSSKSPRRRLNPRDNRSPGRISSCVPILFRTTSFTSSVTVRVLEPQREEVDSSRNDPDRAFTSQVFSMLPGFSAELMPKSRGKESQVKIKRYMTMMDSMTNEELDSSNPKLMNESRIMRIATGAGQHIREVMEMLEEYKRLAKNWSKIKGHKIPKKGEMSALSHNMNAQHMSKALPPRMLKQIGGMGGLRNLMKQMGSAKDMMRMFGGGDE